MKSKKLSNRQALKELVDKHGLDYLNARNMIFGKKEVSLEELDEIVKLIPKNEKVPWQAVKTKLEATKYVSPIIKKNKKFVHENIRGEIRDFVKNLSW